MSTFRLPKRLHWTTWVIFFLEGCLIGYVSLVEARCYSSGGLHYIRGGPMQYTGSRGTLLGTLDDIWVGPLVVDIIVWLLLSIGPAALCEAWSRRGFHFSLRMLFVLQILFAVALSCAGVRSWLREIAGDPVYAMFSAGFLISIGSWMAIASWGATTGFTLVFQHFRSKSLNRKMPKTRKRGRL
jgi:hypothetical protein